MFWLPPFQGRATIKALKRAVQLIGHGVSGGLAVKKEIARNFGLCGRLRAMENYECPEGRVTVDRKGKYG
jgi:hypothetical protein